MSSNFTPTEHPSSQFSWHKARWKNSKVLFWHKERCDSPRGYIEFSICIQFRKRRDLYGDVGTDDEADTVWWCAYKNSSQRWGTLYWLYFLDKNSKNFCCVCRFWLRRKGRIFQFYVKMHVNFEELHEVCEMSWYSRESLRVFLVGHSWLSRIANPAWIKVTLVLFFFNGNKILCFICFPQ